MNWMIKSVSQLVLGLLLFASGFLFGKYWYSSNYKTSEFVTIESVKEISEWNALTVTQVRTKTLYKDMDGMDARNPGTISWRNIWASINKNKLTLTVPITIKYGVQVDSLNTWIEPIGKDSVHITLPSAQMTSLEVMLDEVVRQRELGLLAFQDEEFMLQVQQKMYSDSKNEFSKRQNYHQTAEDRLVKELRRFYRPLGVQVGVTFVNPQT